MKPWISRDIKFMIDEKHRLFKLAKENNMPFHIYNNHKNSLTKHLKLAKARYYRDKFAQCRMNMRKHWKTINLILNKNNKSSYPSKIVHDDIEITNCQDISNVFSNYFSSVATDLDSNIPLSNIDPLDFLTEALDTSFFVRPASVAEVSNIIKSLPNKAGALNVVPVLIYKNLSTLVVPIICDIFNSSVAEGIFPDILKEARVVPVFKSKNKKIVSNFRPISILSTLSKIIEKIMKVRVVEYLDEHRIIYDKQFGFRTRYSTSDAVVELVDECASNLDKGLFTVVIFLDLSKAFDIVNKNIMVAKLEKLGFRGVAREWFDSYLTDRKTYVNISDKNSDVKTLNLGLPQGSVSAPWLFSLYVNDMHRASDKLNFIHFADDTTIYRSGSDLSSLCQEINFEMNRILDWLKANRLSLNIEKTKFMLFTHSSVDPNSLNISLNNINVERVNSRKFLGITIDERLNYNDHVAALARKLSCTVGVMSKLSEFVPPNIIKLLYYSIFYPHLLYGVVVWGGCGVTNANKIVRLQNRALSPYRDKIENLAPQISFENLYKFSVLCMFHKCLFTNHNIYFKEKILKFIPTHQHPTRFRLHESFRIPKFNKSVCQKQFFFNSIKCWNELPVDMKSIEDGGRFMRGVKKLLRDA